MELITALEIVNNPWAANKLRELRQLPSQTRFYSKAHFVAKEEMEKEDTFTVCPQRAASMAGLSASGVKEQRGNALHADGGVSCA